MDFSVVLFLCRVDISEIKGFTMFDVDSSGEVSDDEAKVRWS